ncbi:hypothetical protein AB0I49_34120 [Streptomyces sp. NPDC050617]|uniref:hypothetical protein n=1 Tax=Streptomyces sp. NPDC050617 TaxID=3154628 RepID=UPI0034301AFE
MLRYDRTSVAHWLAGTRPSAHIAELVAEALSRRLHRPITLADTNLARPDHPTPANAAPRQAEDPVARLVELAGTGRGRRAVPRPMAYSTGTTLPGLPSPLSAGSPAPTSASAAAKVGPVHGQSAELMVKVFADSDAMFGGGRARTALTAYLATDVAGRLRAPASASTRRRLLRTASQLAYLAGYMCFDEHLNGVAQVYYRSAAEFAAAASDLVGYSTALRAMSIQAYHLGHRAQALDLAEAAGRHHHRVPGGQAGLLTAQLAVAEAGRGDRRASFSHLAQAERLLDQGEDDQGTIGVYHPAALAHQEAEVLLCTGDRAGAIRALNLSLRHRPAGERRARALTTARLAHLHFDQGSIEEAAARCHAFLDDATGLQSTRADQVLASLRSRLRTHQRSAAVRTVIERLDQARHTESAGA